MTDPDGGSAHPESPVPPLSGPGAPPPTFTTPPPTPPGSGGYTAPPPGHTAPAPGYTAVGAAPPKTLSLIGMIAGIVGVVSLGWFLPASIAALILGYMGRKREGLPARGFWLTAIITGWVGIALTVLFVGGVILVAILAGVARYTTNGY